MCQTKKWYALVGIPGGHEIRQLWMVIGNRILIIALIVPLDTCFRQRPKNEGFWVVEMYKFVNANRLKTRNG